jgi:DMSO/TMAO reductase YedYZ heme-binding membrane subunit
VSQQQNAPIRSTERILAFMIAGIIAASILSFLGVIAGTFFGVTQAQFGQGAWPVVTIFPLIGLPIAFVLLVVLLVMSLRRRAKEAPKAR